MTINTDIYTFCIGVTMIFLYKSLQTFYKIGLITLPELTNTNRPNDLHLLCLTFNCLINFYPTCLQKSVYRKVTIWCNPFFMCHFMEQLSFKKKIYVSVNVIEEMNSTLTNDLIQD